MDMYTFFSNVLKQLGLMLTVKFAKIGIGVVCSLCVLILFLSLLPFMSQHFQLAYFSA